MIYYKVDEIAEMLKVNKFTVYRWIREKKLKADKIESFVRISQEYLEEFISKNK